MLLPQHEDGDSTTHALCCALKCIMKQDLSVQNTPQGWGGGVPHIINTWGRFELLSVVNGIAGSRAPDTSYNGYTSSGHPDPVHPFKLELP